MSERMPVQPSRKEVSSSDGPSILKKRKGLLTALAAAGIGIAALWPSDKKVETPVVAAAAAPDSSDDADESTAVEIQEDTKNVTPDVFNLPKNLPSLKIDEETLVRDEKERCENLKELFHTFTTPYDRPLFERYVVRDPEHQVPLKPETAQLLKKKFPAFRIPASANPETGTYGFYLNMDDPSPIFNAMEKLGFNSFDHDIKILPKADGSFEVTSDLSSTPMIASSDSELPDLIESAMLEHSLFERWRASTEERQGGSFEEYLKRIDYDYLLTDMDMNEVHKIIEEDRAAAQEEDAGE